MKNVNLNCLLTIACYNKNKANTAESIHAAEGGTFCGAGIELVEFTFERIYNSLITSGSSHL